MFRFCIEKPIILTIAVLITCLFGLLAMFSVPVQMSPDIDQRVISVTTSWPGATPQDIEQEIIVEQEEYLRNIAGVERMVATAQTGTAIINLEFGFDTDLNELLIKVNNALAQVPDYPENVDEPRIETNSPSEQGFIYLFITPLKENADTIDMVAMQDFIQDNVAVRFDRIQGVSRTEVQGGAERQVQIYLDPARLAEREIRLIDVRNAIRARNRDVSGGDLNSGKRRYLVRTRGRFDNLDDIENLVIAERDGTFIRLSDVGYVDMSTYEIRGYAWSKGDPAIMLIIRKQAGSNVIETYERVVAQLDDINETILNPAGMYIREGTDDAKYVGDAVSNVYRNLFIGAILAVIVLFLFLRSASATLLGAIGIPVCTIAAFVGILITGRTINVISLAGVAFSIGMTLDNSIVVLENIYRYMGEGKSRFEAALQGVIEVYPAVLASTLTTVMVFLPIVFIQQEAGQLYSDIAIAISASILMSMIIAITLIPAACSRFLKPHVVKDRQHGFDHFGLVFTRTVMNAVKWSLESNSRSLGVVTGVFVMALMIIFTMTPAAEYLPEGEENKVFSFVFAPSGYNIEESHKIALEINNRFSPFVDRDPDNFDRGVDEVPSIYSMLTMVQADGILFLPEVYKGSHVDDLMDLISEETSRLPGIFSFTSRGSIFSSNFGGTRAINVDISGNRLEDIYQASFMAFNRARELFPEAQIRQTPPNLSLGQPFVEIYPDWERAAELGLDADNLGYTIWAYSDGAFVDEFFQDDDKIDMYLYSTEGTVERIDDFNNLLIYSDRGGVVPLSAVARVEETVNTESIQRIDGDRTVTLTIIAPRSLPLETGVATVEDELIDFFRNSGELTPDIRMRMTGASDLMAATREVLTNNFIIAVLISYLVMVAIFSHWGYPFIIMTTVPIGISGGLIGLALLNVMGANLDLFGLETFNQPFDMITMLGFLVLIGTTVNNPILIVERTMSNLSNQGLTIKEAITEATHTRLRPIMISSITTVFGLSPLVFYPGAGTELYRGLGAIVLFGILFSSVVTLSFMPSFLNLILHMRDKFVVIPVRPAPE